LAAALFIPDRMHAASPEMIHGVHLALLVLGALTIVSTIAFNELKGGDGGAVSRHKAELPSG
jgi:hypothetical protein